MKLASTQYSLNTKSFDIYISGCREHPCVGCCNPEIHDENIGEELNDAKIEQILNKINSFDNLIENIFILGGEVLEKPIDELEWLLKKIKSSNKKIWLFTRFELDEIPFQIKKYCSYIKTGKYDQTQLSENNINFGVKLASSNQKIYKIMEDQ